MFTIAQEKLPTAQYLKTEFFFIMSNYGYSSPTAKTSGLIVEDPLIQDGKIMKHQKRFGDFLLVFTDRWWNGGGQSTFHLQNIVGQQILLWSMTYSGSYNKIAIPTLMGALRTTYNAREFCGGRGPNMYPSDDKTMTYFNTYDGDFSHFSANEKILGKVGEEQRLLGGHYCWGGLHTLTVSQKY